MYVYLEGMPGATSGLLPRKPARHEGGRDTDRASVARARANPKESSPPEKHLRRSLLRRAGHRRSNWSSHISAWVWKLGAFECPGEFNESWSFELWIKAGQACGKIEEVVGGYKLCSS